METGPRAPRPALYAFVVAGSAVAAFLGFAREAALGALFGASRATDAFYAALALPFIAAYFLVGGALAPALTAALAARLERGETDAARLLLRRSLRTVLLWGGAAALLLAAGAGPAAHLLVPGFGPEDVRLTARLLRELCAYGLLTSLALLVAAALNAAGAYRTPVVAVLTANATALLILLAARRSGIPAAAWALGAGSLLQLAVSLRRLHALGLLARPENVRASVPLPWREGALLALSLGLAGAVDLAERPFASAAGVGAIALLAFASKLIHLPMRLFAAPLAAVAFPRLVRARQRTANGSAGEAETTARLVLELLLYASAVAAGAAGPLVAVTLGRGRFDAAAVARLATILLALSPAIVAIGFHEIGTKYLLAAGRAPAIVLAQAAGLAAFVAAALALGRFGVVGLALARDVAWATSALALALPLLAGRERPLPASAVLRPLGSALLAAGLAGMTVRLCPGGPFVRLPLAALAATLPFAAMAFSGRARRAERPAPSVQPT